MENINDKSWFVYILRCSDTTLYTGITTDIERRIKEHNNTKKGAAYTRERRPVSLRYMEGPMTKSAALKREFEIKKMRKKDKEKLVGNNDFSMTVKDLKNMLENLDENLEIRVKATDNQENVSCYYTYKITDIKDSYKYSTNKEIFCYPEKVSNYTVPIYLLNATRIKLRSKIRK